MRHVRRRAWSSPNSGRRAALAACDVKDDLPADVPAFQDSVCLGGCLQREQVADDRLPGTSVRQRREGPGAWPVVVLNQHAVEADVGIQQSVQIERPGGDGRDPARPVAAPSGQPRRVCRRPRSAMGVDRATSKCQRALRGVLKGVVGAQGRAQPGHLIVHRLPPTTPMVSIPAAAASRGQGRPDAAGNARSR